MVLQDGYQKISMGNALMKVLVFDLGGTLMEYKGMPYSWVDYYEKSFEAVNIDLNLNLSTEDIKQSCEILKSKNARVVYREVEYTPEEIFIAVTEHWQNQFNIDDVINSFYKGHNLIPEIYADTVGCIKQLKESGFKISALTDLPTGMPDELFRKDITDIISHFDLYVSSLTSGFRKPNATGLLYIAKHFNTNVQELIFIGDEEKDIKTAKNVNCTSVLINRGNINNDPKEYGQNFTISSLRELYDIVA